MLAPPPLRPWIVQAVKIEGLGYFTVPPLTVGAALGKPPPFRPRFYLSDRFCARHDIRAPPQPTGGLFSRSFSALDTFSLIPAFTHYANNQNQNPHNRR